MDHEDVQDRDSFVAYIGVLRKELAIEADWEKVDLASFLEAMQAWAQD